MSSTPDRSPRTDGKHSDHWVRSIRIVLFILSLWLLLSLGCGVLFRQWLDNNLPNVGGAPFGFWMAQQGAIIGFLILLILYMVLMNAVDRKDAGGRGDLE